MCASFLRQRNVIHRILLILNIGMEWNVIYLELSEVIYCISKHVKVLFVYRKAGSN